MPPNEKSCMTHSLFTYIFGTLLEEFIEHDETSSNKRLQIIMDTDAHINVIMIDVYLFTGAPVDSRRLSSSPACNIDPFIVDQVFKHSEAYNHRSVTLDFI